MPGGAIAWVHRERCANRCGAAACGAAEAMNRGVRQGRACSAELGGTHKYHLNIRGTAALKHSIG